MKLITAIANISLAASAPAQVGDSSWLTEEMLRLVEVVLSSDVIIAGIVVGGSCWAVKYTVPKIVEYLQKGGEVLLPWGMKLGPGTPKMVGEISEGADPDKTRKGAECEDAQAQFVLGLMYDKGEGVARDAAAAAKWFRRAAEQGHAQAQYNLGVAYHQGEGVARDAAAAAKWWRLAAEQGFADAQVLLGAMYSNGEGVPQDSVEAAKWTRCAAEQGDAAAQFNLGVAYHQGKGVAQNRRETFIWLSLAAANGLEKAAEAQEKIAKRLPPADLSSAQAEAIRRHAEIQRKCGK